MHGAMVEKRARKRRAWECPHSSAGWLCATLGAFRIFVMTCSMNMVREDAVDNFYIASLMHRLLSLLNPMNGPTFTIIFDSGIVLLCAQDMNGIIHPCFHPEEGLQPKSEDEVFALIIKGGVADRCGKATDTGLPCN